MTAPLTITPGKVGLSGMVRIGLAGEIPGAARYRVIARPVGTAHAVGALVSYRVVELNRPTEGTVRLAEGVVFRLEVEAYDQQGRPVGYVEGPLVCGPHLGASDDEDDVEALRRAARVLTQRARKPNAVAIRVMVRLLNGCAQALEDGKWPRRRNPTGKEQQHAH